MLLNEAVYDLVYGILLVFDFLVEVKIDIGLVVLSFPKVQLVSLSYHQLTFFKSRSESLTLESRLIATMLLWYSFLSASKCLSTMASFSS